MLVKLISAAVRAGVMEQRFAVAGILGGDDRHTLRVSAARGGREVAEVPRGRRDDVEGAGHVTTSPPGRRP